MPGSDACVLSTNLGCTSHATAIVSLRFLERNFKFPFPYLLEMSVAVRAWAMAVFWYMRSTVCSHGVARRILVNSLEMSYSVSVGSASSRSTAQLYTHLWDFRMREMRRA